MSEDGYYRKRCDIIINIIKSKYPDIPSKVSFDNGLCVLHIYDFDTIYLQVNSTWKDVDDAIKKIIIVRKEKDIDEEYRYTCDVFSTIIKSKYPEASIEIFFNTKKICELCINGVGVVSIRQDSTWEDIDRVIKKIIWMNSNIECLICCEKKIKYIRCHKCAEPYCLDCHIKILKTNMGVSKCPFCRDTYGFKLSENELNVYIKTIMQDIDQQISKINDIPNVKKRRTDDRIEKLNQIMGKTLLKMTKTE